MHKSLYLVLFSFVIIAFLIIFVVELILYLIAAACITVNLSKVFKLSSLIFPDRNNLNKKSEQESNLLFKICNFTHCQYVIRSQLMIIKKIILFQKAPDLVALEFLL